MRYAWSAVLVGISTALLPARAWAAPLRLEQRVVPACIAAASELGTRVERSLGSSPPNELEAFVSIETSGAGYRVTVALRDDTESKGTTVIQAPTCDEATDAAAVVLALAFGKMTGSEATKPPSSSLVAAPPRARLSPIVTSAPMPARLDRGVHSDSAPSSGPPRRTQLSLTTGVDGGTLPQPTLMVGGSIVRAFGGLELAAIARYGLPITNEAVETGYSESQRHDFGGLELRACRGVGHAFRLSACAGTEVGAVRARRSHEGEDHTAIDEERFSPRLSATLAALVAHRGGLIEPGLELGGAALALGHEAGAARLAVRVAGVAAIAF